MKPRTALATSCNQPSFTDLPACTLTLCVCPLIAASSVAGIPIFPIAVCTYKHVRHLAL
jgi:hypothetical protein